VACPFFAPSRRLENTAWIVPPRYPLGDLFSGTCHTSASNLTEGHQDDHQEDCCNFGYARGRCDRFPGGSAPDAVRFSVTEDTPARLSLIYVVEKDHAPVEHGALEYSIADGRLDGPVISDVLAKQACGFIESYLNRRAFSAST
jgi:hypothetical protein